MLILTQLALPLMISLIPLHVGHNHSLKVEGGQDLGPNTGRLRPVPGQRPRWVLGVGCPPSQCEGLDVSPPENF